MWTCKVCGAVIDDDSWQACWNCSSEKDIDEKNVESAKSELKNYHQEKQELAGNLECVRCGSPLRFLGTKKLHEGASWGFWLGNLGELLVNRIALDQFFCPKCGKIEFFLDDKTLERVASTPNTFED